MINPILALSVLFAALVVSAACFLALWLISLRINDPSFVDSWWALGIVVLVWATYMQIVEPGPHATALLLLGTAWGLRLGVYLLWRWRKHGADRRYAKLAERARTKHKLNFAAFAALWVFLPQMFLQLILALPVLVPQISDNMELGPLAHIGIWLAIAGIVFEGVADAQLAHFKSQSDNDGKVMESGLWRYSRHPNYFGDLVTWWAIWLVALDAGAGLWTLPGPLLITFLLTRVSGAPTTEPHLQRTRPEYEAYKKRTSAFIPMPPKSS
ncbi:MAG: DUF1295 domain-containing protein [Phycisphaerales bacterium]|nr:DUF1295 domain-containing protein [Hyphomonadaceae bacterium]